MFKCNNVYLDTPLSKMLYSSIIREKYIMDTTYQLKRAGLNYT